MSRATYSTYEAKARFSEILRQVRRGDSVFITYRGTEVAEIRPVKKKRSLEERLERLERAGLLKPPAKSRGGDALRPLAERPGALARFLESRD